MTLLWSTPRVWETNEPITKEKLNGISNQLTYLFTPTRKAVTVRGTGTNQTTASTTNTPLDPATYTIQLEVTGVRDIYVKFTGLASNNTLAAFIRVDCMIDSATFVSSLAATPITGGLKSMPAYVAANVLDVGYCVRIPAGTLTAGFHTFVPYWWVSAGTATFLEVNQFSQFEVGEY